MVQGLEVLFYIALVPLEPVPQVASGQQLLLLLLSEHHRHLYTPHSDLIWSSSSGPVQDNAQVFR